MNRTLLLMLWFLMYLLSLSNTLYSTLKHERSFWLSEAVTGKFRNPKFEYIIEHETRFTKKPDPFDHTRLSLDVGYEFNPKVNFWTTYLWTANNGGCDEDVLENSLYETLIISLIKSKKFILASRSLFEQTKPSNDPNWNHLFRQKGTLAFPNCLTKPLILLISDEIYLYIKKPAEAPDSTFHENRFKVQVVADISKKYFIEFGYINRYIIDQPLNRMDHVIFFNFTAKF